MKNIKSITNSSSIILDSFRIVAALVVLEGHLFEQWFAHTTTIQKKIDFGHTAVIVFFVLSGYVIGYTTISNNRGFFFYIRARLTRLYSIVFPALIITILIELFVWHIDPALHQEYTRGSSSPRYLMALLFLNESWFVSASPPFNGPLWSLGFEFWFYIIFGLWLYKSNQPKIYLLLIIACIIAGPKILMMMLIWLFGYFAYKIPKPSLKYHSLNSFVFVMFGILVMLFCPPIPFRLGTTPLFFAGQFITDYLLGFSVGGILWCLPLSENPGPRSKFSKLLRVIADLTFPVYVLHYPLIILFRAFYGTQLINISQFIAAFFSVLLICFIIGYFLDKQREYWKRIFNFFLLKIRVAFFKQVIKEDNSNVDLY